MNRELEVLASELPVLQTKGTYKYLKEITGNGAYYQVAWQKLVDGYVALYGTTPIQTRSLPTLNDIFEDEEG
ncbi:hypothetical protein NVV78_03785 [Pediococcus ethanolidurans]|uniref:hypothetical protein n=1 Tax=Pediococcus ethanolidurans TaxID=319653 RepID=UPI001C1E8FB7|nr:hypothetical protein [Pediococcus ethanolidurans]MBU7555650.1 hypothetical protein [Pediococcus ethanolidurans]MBU7564356.1 hypothetical protein [Pediococcus ethanolidurans]MCT4397784.1 hypothetical protein [Pediococcus ethanolidurans]MCV3315070.1 hypothetical protein [Pediococcus ethanolidurans]MCV3322366.1 hypothetical protein [Pediococcus ethanolidurans]